MWQCPKCKREFKNTNQDHYCCQIETIDHYILEQAEEVQPILNKIREAIRIAAPEAIEKMSWQMPTFWQGENLIHFAAFKKHISIFPGGEATTVFADRLTDYKTAKGTIQLPLNKPIPYNLIEEITHWRVSAIEDKNKMNGKTNEQQLLRNRDIEPTSEVIAEGLGAANDAYVKFIGELKNHDIQIEWRYYTDGKAWLGKGMYRWTGVRGGQKEVTAFWLSIWEGFFKVTIYVPEKARVDALNLTIDDEIKQMIADSKQMGKLNFFPLVFDLHSDELFEAVYVLADFRKRIK